MPSRFFLVWAYSTLTIFLAVVGGAPVDNNTPTGPTYYLVEKNYLLSSKNTSGGVEIALHAEIESESESEGEGDRGAVQSVLESNFSVENHYLPKECREEYGDLCREILLLDLTEDGNDTKEVAFLALTGAVLLVEVRHTDSQVFISDWYLLPLDHDDDHHCDPTSYSSMPSGVLAVCFNVDVPYLNVLSVHLDSMTGLLNGTATRLMYESSLQVEVPPLLSNFLPVVQPHAQKLYYSSQNYLHELQPFRLSSELDIGSMEPCDTAYHLALLESEQAGEVIIAYCRPDSACEVDTMTSFEECSDRQPYPCPNSSTKFFIETSAADGTFMITVLTENGSNEKSIYSSFASGMCLQTGQNTFFFVYTDGSGNMHLLSAEGLEEKQLAIPGCQDPPTYQLLQPFNNRYLIVNEQCGTTGNKKTVVLDMSDSFSRLIVTNDSEAVSFVVIPHVQKVIDIMATPDPNATGSNNSSVSSSAEPPTPTPSYPSSPPYSSPAATPAPSSPPIASHSTILFIVGAIVLFLVVVGILVVFIMVYLRNRRSKVHRDSSSTSSQSSPTNFRLTTTPVQEQYSIGSDDQPYNDNDAMNRHIQSQQ